MGRKRKLFLGTEPIGGKDMKSRRKARFVTSQYHDIRNEMAAIDNDKRNSIEEKQEKKKYLNERLEAIGGVNKYQQASIISTSHFRTSRWVISTLEQLGCRKKAIPGTEMKSHIEDGDIELSTKKRPSTSESKLNVLEVGAINVQLQQCDWLTVRAIDVNSQHSLIEECDFFDITPTESFDAVVCSMVINCVTEPVRRGEMLARLYAHIKPVTGVLFLVLPIRCVEAHHIGGKLDALLQAIGFSHLIEKKTTPKLAFYVLKRDKYHVNVNGNVSGKGKKGSQLLDISDSPSLLVSESDDDDDNDGGSKKRKKISEPLKGEQTTQPTKKAKQKHMASGDALNASIAVPAAVGVSWKDMVQAAVAISGAKQNVLDFFCRDVSLVPPKEFCISMSSVLDSNSNSTVQAQRPPQRRPQGGNGKGKKRVKKQQILVSEE